VTWAVWLLVPVVVTVLAALGSWWRFRPKRALAPDEAMRAHTDFLDALANRPRK
jgi:nitrate reductase gamma subunit